MKTLSKISYISLKVILKALKVVTSKFGLFIMFFVLCLYIYIKSHGLEVELINLSSITKLVIVYMISFEFVHRFIIKKFFDEAHQLSDECVEIINERINA